MSGTSRPYDESRRWRHPVRERGLRVLLVIGAVALAWVGSGLPSHSWAATAAVAAPALAATVLAVRGGSTSASSPGTRLLHTPRLRLAVSCWMLLVSLGLLWQLWAFLDQPAWNVSNPEHPTLSLLLASAFEHRGIRFIAWLGWLHVGARLVR